MAKLLVIISGASQGFGRALAEGFGAGGYEAGAEVTYVLLARSKDKLDALAASLPGTSHVHACDLSAVGELSAVCSAIETNVPHPEAFDRVFLVNNVGSLGDLSKRVADQSDLGELRAYFDLNLLHVILFVSWFLRFFAAHGNTCIVNVSSLLAVQTFPNWGLYAAGKFARDALHATVAKEGRRTLNYAPGPLDTGMQAEVRTTIGDQEQREVFTKMSTEGTLVSPAASAAVLLKVLKANTFESGAHLDFYDVPATPPPS